MSDQRKSGPWDAPEPKVPARDRPARTRGRRIGRLAWLALLGVGVLAGGAALLRLFPGRVASANDWFGVGSSLLMLTLVGSSLAVDRLRLGQTLRYAAIWGAVASVLLVGLAYRAELAEAGARVRSALIPSYAVARGPRELVLSRSEGGHYAVVGQVNGRPVTFMIDTGASDIVLSPEDARRVGLNLASLRFDRVYGTANGAGRGAAATVDSLAVGPIRLSDVEVSVNEAPMGTSLLGMSFVRRLRSMRFEGDRLTLTWRP